MRRGLSRQLTAPWQAQLHPLNLMRPRPCHPFNSVGKWAPPAAAPHAGDRVQLALPTQAAQQSTPLHDSMQRLRALALQLPQAQVTTPQRQTLTARAHPPRRFVAAAAAASSGKGGATARKVRKSASRKSPSLSATDPSLLNGHKYLSPNDGQFYILSERTSKSGTPYRVWKVARGAELSWPEGSLEAEVDDAAPQTDEAEGHRPEQRQGEAADPSQYAVKCANNLTIAELKELYEGWGLPLPKGHSRFKKADWVALVAKHPEWALII